LSVREIIHQKHGNRLYRVCCSGRFYVLKQFADPDAAREAECYELLQQCGVPTLPLYGRMTDSILLEDLADSTTWRIATEDDLQDAHTGAAIAVWYRRFHDEGYKYLAEAPAVLPFLKPEWDALTPSAVLEAGKRLGMEENWVWRLAADHIESITAAMRSLPQTFNHNDFCWDNLAVSREPRPSLRAVVFDYHLMGTGLAYSDCRNIMGSLGETAKAAFWETYGDIDPREVALDAPVATLYALSEAVARPQLPAWASSLVEQVRDGRLARDIRCALGVL
jgi:hypothetical protein